jgi:uncharacterized membrane protein YphA (DoxX/SURF4 family)
MVNAIDAKASSYHDIALVVGRVLIGALFLIAAYNKSKGYDGRSPISAGSVCRRHR